jgi:Macrocin-O-methyltransferase (TylF)
MQSRAELDVSRMPDTVSSWRDRPASWPYRADPPQRYWGHYRRYQERGGLVDLQDDIGGFVSGGQIGDISRFYFFCLAFDQIRKEGLAGDLAELGVYQGHTATLIARAARRLGRNAYLLDTFQGFDQSDFRGLDSDQKMQFSDTSLDAVRKRVGDENVRFIKGHFPGSAAALPDTSYCLVHIDCDLYAPIFSALEYFYPRVVPGGFLIIHDYSSLAWDGAERAVDEFFADKPEGLIPLTDGAGSVVVRKAHQPATDGDWLSRKRSSQFTDDWTPAANGRIADLLGAGWSGPEEWGIWAVGTEHELMLSLLSPPAGDVIMEVDVHAPLRGTFQEQEIAVFVGGQQLGTWRFTAQTNRGIRTVVIPQALIPHTVNPLIHLELKPKFSVRPADLDDHSSDARLLSMALHRIRRRLT